MFIFFKAKISQILIVAISPYRHDKSKRTDEHESASETVSKMQQEKLSHWTEQKKNKKLKIEMKTFRRETPATAELRGRSWRFVEITWETAIYEWKLKWFLHLMAMINRIHNFPGIRVDFPVNLAFEQLTLSINLINYRAERSQPQTALIPTTFHFSNLFFKFSSSRCSWPTDFFVTWPTDSIRLIKIFIIHLQKSREWKYKFFPCFFRELKVNCRKLSKDNNVIRRNECTSSCCWACFGRFTRFHLTAKIE